MSVLVGALLQGCATPSATSRAEAAEEIAIKAGFKGFTLTGTYFTLQGFANLQGGGETTAIYIEGDGRAWASRTRPSLNPTPVNPLALRLAAFDGRANVIYLGRPCQYVDLTSQPNCQVKYWTSHRFAPEVISDYGLILDQVKQQTGVKQFHLIGFSGGAAVAALLAASRSDVSALVTIAGNLDLEALASHHKVSPLSGSLDPADFASKLVAIPQVHLVGEGDKVIPPGLTKRFFDRQAKNPCLSVQIVPGASHQEGWINQWRSFKPYLHDCR